MQDNKGGGRGGGGGGGRGGRGGGGGGVCRQTWQQREDSIFVINLLSYILWYTATKPMINRKV